MQGEAINKEDISDYQFKDWKGETVTKDAPKEELITTGILENYKYTDNKIREEQGFSKRVKY